MPQQKTAKNSKPPSSPPLPLSADEPIVTRAQLIKALWERRPDPVWVKLTPQLAAELFEHRRAEQHLRFSAEVVRCYARQMQRGFWIADNGDTYRINEAGELDDGQQRVHAVCTSGVTVDALFCLVRNEAFSSMDQGSPRSPKTFLQGKYRTERAACAKWIWHLLNDDFPNRARRVRYHEFQDWASDSAVIYSVGHIYATGAKKLFEPSFLAFLHWVYTNYHTDHDADIDEVFEELGVGANVAATNPMLLLRNRLLDARASGASSRSAYYLRKLCIKAVTYRIKGQPLRTLRVSEYEESPSLELSGVAVKRVQPSPQSQARGKEPQA